MVAKFTKYVCTTCGSDDVMTDAWAEWNPATMQNELRSSFDDEHCESCEGECRTEEVEITDPEEIAAIRKARVEMRAKDNAIKMANILIRILGVCDMADPEHENYADSAADCLQALLEEEATIREVIAKIRTENLDKPLEPVGAPADG